MHNGIGESGWPEQSLVWGGINRCERWEERRTFHFYWTKSARPFANYVRPTISYGYFFGFLSTSKWKTIPDSSFGFKRIKCLSGGGRGDSDALLYLAPVWKGELECNEKFEYLCGGWVRVDSNRSEGAHRPPAIHKLWIKLEGNENTLRQHRGSGFEWNVA